MYELCVQQMRGAYVPGANARRTGNADPNAFHQGVYATRGNDRWVAVTFQSSADWARFSAAHDITATAATDRDTALTAWFGSRLDVDAANELQQIGIAAGVVQDMADLFERDPQLAARNPLISFDHPLLGAFGHMRTPIDFSRSVPQPYRAPSIGEHNREIAQSLCHLSAQRFAELESLGVLR
jgi:crotonobetainyl-CoA:carnitine CoA-transferase CaiB-like acyl-CoA transferase